MNEKGTQLSDFLPIMLVYESNEFTSTHMKIYL